jgi:Mg-chelatase subunit ChlD
VSFGDLLHGVPQEAGWLIRPVPGHYADGISSSDESAYGGLAVDPGSGLLVSANVSDIFDSVDNSRARWYEPSSGNAVQHESICPWRTSLPSPWAAFRPGWTFARPAWADDEWIPAPNSVGDIEVLCRTEVPTPTSTPSPEPTLTGVPLPSATATATSTATPSPTLTATATPTPTPAPAILPLLLREECTPTQRRVDAVLVLDTSTSMLDPTREGGSKLAAAQAAARAFLAALRLDAGDQVGLVAFNSDAWLVSELTQDGAALEAAIAGLTTGQQTRIDRGIAVAAAELASTRRRGDNVPVMVVLTDGRNNPVPVEEAVSEAARAKAAGNILFTVGLGPDVEAAALAAMASRPDYAYLTPDAAALAGIYEAIAVTIPCPAEAFWGRR